MPLVFFIKCIGCHRKFFPLKISSTRDFQNNSRKKPSTVYFHSVDNEAKECLTAISLAWTNTKQICI